MNNEAFCHWCESATALIRYGPDRKAVEAELMAHLEDHRDALVAEGMADQEAQRAALIAMGDADALAEALAKVHRPFWGYLYRLTKWVAILVCAFALFILAVEAGSTAHSLLTASEKPEFMHPGDGRKWELVVQAEPEVSAWCDGHWISIPGACLWQQGDEYRLTFHLQTVSLSPYGNFEGIDYFWAIDDRGNYYNSRDEGHYKDDPCVRCGGGMFSGRYQRLDMSIWDIPSADLQWIELHYDRDGRDIVLRIDLDGGEAQ